MKSIEMIQGVSSNINLVESPYDCSCEGCYYFDEEETDNCSNTDPYCSKDTIYKEITPEVESTSKIDIPNDPVIRPLHYQIFPEYSIEVRDICKVMSDRIEAKGYTAFFISDYVQMLQYVLRFQDKNGVEDLEKAMYYLTKMIEQENN